MNEISLIKRGGKVKIEEGRTVDTKHATVQRVERPRLEREV